MNSFSPNTAVNTLLFFLLSISVQATDYYVDAAATSGLNNGSSWNNAFTSLQTALNSALFGDNVYVAGGTYYPTTSGRAVSFVIKDGVQVYGGFNPSNGIRELTTILSGDIGTPIDNSDNSYSVVYIQNAGVSTILDGFTITAGNSNGPAGIRSRSSGGGICIEATGGNDCSPIIQSCIVVSNSASGDGGGIFIGAENVSASAGPTLIHCTVSNNIAAQGGGIYCSGNVGSTNTSIISCDINGNSASSTGGAIYNYSKIATGSCNTSAVNTIIRNNSAGSAAGFYSITASGDGCSTTGSIVNCVFYGNDSHTGGAVYVNEDSGSNTSTTVSNSIFWNSRGGFSPHFHFSDDDGNSTPEITISHSIVDAFNCNFMAPGGGELVCGSGMQYNIDPQFISAGTDFGLLPTSSAVNAGDNSTIGATGISTDFIDNLRIQVGVVDLGIYETSFGILPVELTNFDAKPYEESFTRLLWNTASELDNDYFTIERSRNGIDFLPIGEVSGAGTTDVAQSYSFIDRSPFGGINYYRLKQNDFDGRFTYSPIRSIYIAKPDSTPSVYPNPATDFITFDTGDGTTDQALDYAIYDWSGRIVQQGIMQIAYGTANIQLDGAQSLAMGFYILKAEGIEGSFKFVMR